MGLRRRQSPTRRQQMSHRLVSLQNRIPQAPFGRPAIQWILSPLNGLRDPFHQRELKHVVN
jgi:hypothetical protein